MKWNEKTVLVFGAGKSGIGACTLLNRLGLQNILYDGNEKLSAEDIENRLEEDMRRGISVAERLAGKACAAAEIRTEILLGDFPEERLGELSLVVMSPGVPCDLPLVDDFRNAGIPVWGEVELAYRTGAGKVFAVTGTNGKTTTTALLGEIMKSVCPEVYVVGNIGNPYTEAALSQSDEAVTVAEISSFQLETIEQFHPAVSVITNITEDHMNRHHTMEEYIRVKELITKNQTADDAVVLNYEDPVLREFGEHLDKHVIWFSSARPLKEGLYYADGEIRAAGSICGEKDDILLVRTADMKLLGLHNFENVMCAAAAALYGGVPAEKIREAVCGFAGVPHRIEFVSEKNGVAYYNDSKGTNPDAAIKGIQAMNRPTLLIGGGYDKQSAYDEWIGSFEGRVRYLVLIGQTREKIAETAVRCGFPEEKIIFCGDLKEAVNTCASLAESGDAVLLSPACASWGQFDNYEQRGDLFKEYVRAL